MLEKRVKLWGKVNKPHSQKVSWLPYTSGEAWLAQLRCVHFFVKRDKGLLPSISGYKPTGLISFFPQCPQWSNTAGSSMPPCWLGQKDEPRSLCSIALIPSQKPHCYPTHYFASLAGDSSHFTYNNLSNREERKQKYKFHHTKYEDI